MYDDLFSQGYLQKDRDTFRNFFFAPGEQGYKNRKALYDDLHGQGYLEAPTYEDFSQRIGLHAVESPAGQPTSAGEMVAQNTAPQEEPTNVPAAQQPKKVNRNAVPEWKLRKGLQMAGIGSNGQWQSRVPNPGYQQNKQRVANSLKMDQGRRAGIGVDEQTGKVSMQSAPKLTSYTPETIVNQMQSETGGAQGDAAVQRVREQMPEHYAWLQERMGDDADRYIMNLAFNKAYGDDPDNFVGRIMQKYGHGDAAEQAWQEAEEAARKEFREYLDERNKPSFSNIMQDMAGASNVTGGLGQNNVEGGIEAFAAHMKYHDLKRMSDAAWNRLGKQNQQAIIGEIQQAIRGFYPNATEGELWDKASDMARQYSDRGVYDYAVAMNTPKSATEYFFKKAGLGTTFGAMMESAARVKAGSIGDMQARDEAWQRYEKDHKGAGITGTVAGMAIDPLTYASGGIGSLATKGFMWLGGKALGTAAMRRFATTLGGRMIAGAVGGSANLGTFMGGSEAFEQARHGGYVNPNTGVITDYNLGAVAGRFGHGALMGLGTGVVAPAIGNVSDKLVRATENTAGKLGIRVGELGISTVAEGTIFSIPEWIEGKRDPMDVWTDNMAMMAGFKVGGLIKSARQRIEELSDKENPQNMAERNHNRMGFQDRLRKMLDGRPDLALSKDEKAELERRGYTDLTELVEGYKDYSETKKQQKKYFEDAKAQGLTNEAARQEAESKSGGIPWNRFTELMEDGSVSEAARAKMYYYLTGQLLPMSTVSGWNFVENKNANGKVTGYTVESMGVNGVITSKTFTSKKAATAERNRIERQAELNTIDIGERFYNEKYDSQRMYEACRRMSERTGVPVNSLYNMMKMDAESMSDVEARWAEDVMKEYEALSDETFAAEDGSVMNVYGTEVKGLSAIREEIGYRFGVDLDKAIGKDRSARSRAEQQAVEEYINRLYEEMEREGQEPVAEETIQDRLEMSNRTGYYTPDEGQQDIKRRYDVARQRLRDLGFNDYQIEYLEGLDKQGILDELGEMEGREDAVAEAVREFLDARAAYEGMVDRVQDDIDNEVQTSDEMVDQQTNKKTGMTQRATLKGGGEVFIIDGEVNVVNGEIDLASSSSDLVVFNPATGKPDMISINDLASADESIPADQVKQENADAIRETKSTEASNRIEGVLPFQPGDKYEVLVDESPVEVTVIEDQGENVVVQFAGSAEPTVMTKSMIQDAANALRDVQIAEQAAELGSDDGEVPLQSSDTENPPAEDEEPVIEEPVEEEEVDRNAMPMDDQGEPAWNQVAPERGHKYLYQESGWPQAMADNFVQARIDEAEKALKKVQDDAQKLIDNPKKTFAENNAAMAMYTAAQQEAQAALDYWKGVQGIQAAATAPVVEETAPVVETPAEQEPTEQAPVAEAEAPAEPVEEVSAVEAEQPEQSLDAAVAEAEQMTDTNPTEGQKEAGNYRKGHVNVHGFEISIEQPKGSVRSGVDADGHEWSQEMHNTYGYIQGTEGVDGDHIDVFLSDHLDDWNGLVFVVDQVNKDGSFDEHKVMIGFNSTKEAQEAYLSNYEEGWTGLGDITVINEFDFKDWINSSHRKTKPFAEYKIALEKAILEEDESEEPVAPVAENEMQPVEVEQPAVEPVQSAGTVDQAERWEPAEANITERGRNNQYGVYLEVGNTVSFYTDGTIHHGDIIDFDGDETFTIREWISKRNGEFKDVKRTSWQIPRLYGKQKNKAADVEAGGAVVDQLQKMGVDISTDLGEYRTTLSEAKKDNSEAGTIKYMKTSDGTTYGFTYRGKIHIDPRKINADLPLHEYGHLWGEAVRKLAPDTWKQIVDVLKSDADTWNFLKARKPELTTDDAIADEMIAEFSGKNGEQRLKDELERMSQSNADYKTRWGNIFKNIVKAIQDFWKSVGDFLHIDYKTPQQIYDQVLKDFASGMNPRERVERYLKERDADFVDAVNRGDTETATRLFNEALAEEVGNGMTPFISVGGYGGKLRDLARKVKNGNEAAIEEVADIMAPIIPKNAVLIPAPSHTGRATYMLDIANAIAKRTGSDVADILVGPERARQYDQKKETGKPIASKDLGVTVNGEIPEGKVPVVLDNVVATGNTAEACVQALGKGIVCSLAKATDQYNHVASLKSANVVVRDSKGNVIPLSKRFDLSQSKRLGNIQFSKAEGETEPVSEQEAAVRDALIDVMRDAGIEVITDTDEGQRVLDEANGANQTYSANFKNWFGDWEGDPEHASKVVDAEGRPLVVYRGGEKINIFEPDKASRMAMYGPAFYATPSYVDAQEFGKGRTGNADDVQAVYLDIRNPWVDGPCESLGYPKEATMEQARELVDLLTSKGLVDGDIILAKWNDGRVRSLIGTLADAEYQGVERGRGEWWHASDIVQDALKELGYDGVIGRFDSGDGHMVEQVAAFEPTQIKSATENNGDFDPNNPDIRFSRKEDEERTLMNPRAYVPNVRGGWTEKKILRYLKANSTKSGVKMASKAIAEFDSIEELKEHMFYHGTRNGSDKLKPSIAFSDREFERIGGGGGYGEKYWGISVSKSKRISSNFSTGRGVNIYPIILLKRAKVVERPDFSDAYDAGEHIVELWDEGVDAVWIGQGKQGGGEQELLILNPQAVVNIGTPDFYEMYHLGSQDNPLNIADDEAIARMYETAKEFAGARKPSKPMKPQKPLSLYRPAPSKPSYISRSKYIPGEGYRELTEEEYQAEKKRIQEEYDAEIKQREADQAAYDEAMEDYERKIEEYNNSEEVRAYNDLERRARRDVRFFRTEGGEAYGFVKDGKVYIDQRIATSETPIHEYGHLWGEALRQANPEAWEQLSKVILEEQDVLDYVKQLYPELEGDQLVEEVFNHYSGRRGRERLEREQEEMLKQADGVLNKAKIYSMFAKIKSALKRFWQMARDLFAGKTEGLDKLTAEDFADMMLNDLLNGVDPRKEVKRAQERLNQEGVITGSSGDVRYSWRYRLESEKDKQRQARDIRIFTGATKKEVKRWQEDMDSMTAYIMGGLDVFDYPADSRFVAIKKNSDYPQGTVDFNNICPKRKDMTSIWSILQRENPGRIFTALDLETIRQTMIEDGLKVACGLCFVEDRRQRLGEIAQDFIDNLKADTLKPEVDKLLIDKDYIPSIAELIDPEESERLHSKRPDVYNAFVRHNNARGQQAGRLFEGYAEYKREILKWTDKKVKAVNDAGGLRIFSFSDFDAPHLLDIMQIIADCAARGVKIQGYTKVPEFARAVRNTGLKLNRSLIPKGTGIKEVDGKKVLDYDTTEGIDVNDPNFLDEEDNPNVGNILVGINDEQIRLAMVDPFVDYIIPFHTGLPIAVRKKKGIDGWKNYKNSQRDKDKSTGKAAEKEVNIYTDVLQAAEAEGKPIRNKRQFVEKFLQVCNEKGLIPRYSQFLDKDENGNFIYTEGYHKFPIDFKMFDRKTGRILPQQIVRPDFDDAFNKEIMDKYAENSKVEKDYSGTLAKLRERLGLEAPSGEGDNVNMQGFGSAGTSLNQVARAFRHIDWKPGTVNVDIGGGRFDRATEYLAEKEVENLVFDPFNRDAEHNRAIAERVREKKADTVTCNNVLNVIDTERSRANVILQAAKALKPEGTAYFSVYEGDKSGVGRQTKSDSWQNNRPTKDYIDEVKQYFDDVTLKNNIIIAKSPKATYEQSVWDFDGTYSGNSLAFETGSTYNTKDGRQVVYKSLFGGSDESLSSQQNERSASRQNEADRIRAMSDDELLRSMTESNIENGERDFYTEEYDRRHIQEYNAECDRYRQMLEENEVTEEQADDMLVDIIRQWKDNATTAERTILLAQFDTINDYYNEKVQERQDREWEDEENRANAEYLEEIDDEDLSEDERIEKQRLIDLGYLKPDSVKPSQAEPEAVEPAQPVQPKPRTRKPKNIPTALRLRPLEEGEQSHVERRYVENNMFDFTGTDKIESAADIAYIFRQLETSSVENVFLVLIKKGKPTIIHVGMGGYTMSVGNIGAGILAASAINPDHVVMLHNHPSGNLAPSAPDRKLHKKVEDIFGADKVRPSIIIDITSGKYAEFTHEPDFDKQGRRSDSIEGEVSHQVYSFSKMVFDKDWDPETAFKVTDSSNIAAFVSSHRLGEHDKVSLIVLDNANHIVGNIFLPWTSLNELKAGDIGKEVSMYIHQMGGTRGVLYGSGVDLSSEKAKAVKAYLQAGDLSLLDCISVEKGSYFDRGMLYEPDVEYGYVHDDSVEPEASDEELDAFKEGFNIQDGIARGLARLAQQNKDKVEARRNAVRAISDNIRQLQSAMRKQRNYDRYTVNAIINTAKVMLDSGLFNGLQRSEVKRLLGMVNASVGREDISRQAEKVVDLLQDHQLREWEDLLQKMLRVKASKPNSSGVQVQGALDIEGQRMVQSFKEHMDIVARSAGRLEDENGDDTDWGRAIKECEDRMSSNDPVVAKNAQQEYDGILLAQQWYNEVVKHDNEIKNLKAELRDAQKEVYDFERIPVTDEDGNIIYRQDGEPRTQLRKRLKPEFGGMDENGNRQPVSDENKAIKKNLKEYERSVQASIRDIKEEQVEGYRRITDAFGQGLNESARRAKEWRDAQVERVNDIHHNINSDIEGRPAKSQPREVSSGLLEPTVNNTLLKPIQLPAQTFEKILRYLGKHAFNGEGYLFNRFVPGYMRASNQEFERRYEAMQILDEKVREVFGGQHIRRAGVIPVSVHLWRQLYDLEKDYKRFPPIKVTYWDHGNWVDDELTHGEALYIYMVNKMNDGVMKLRRMGISEVTVERIKQHLDPRFIEIADWLQDEFLPSRRELYSEVYERMYGAPMPAVENYVHLVINKGSIDKDEDINNYAFDATNPSTVTGSVIKRTRNSKPIDIHTDVFDLIARDIDDMEHWAAFAEYNRDLNTMRNYGRLRNALRNVKSVEFGGGQQMLKAFDDACAVVAGSYRPALYHSKLDKWAYEVMRMAVGACIALRNFTAFKQTLSIPSFLSEASAEEFAKHTNPFTLIGSVAGKADWEWAEKNLPGFRKRWLSRQMGDPRMLKSELGLSRSRQRIAGWFSRYGMWLNARVDAAAVATGAHAVYETKKKQYLKEGYTPELAESKALADAWVAYNNSQQSTEGPFVSPVQLDKTSLSMLFTMFRTASMSYNRKNQTAARNLKYRLSNIVNDNDYMRKSIDFMKKLYEREGLGEDQAKDRAEHMYNRGKYKAVWDMVIYSFILTALWNMGKKFLQVTDCDDEQTRDNAWRDILAQTAFGPVEGWVGGDLVSDVGTLLLTGEDVTARNVTKEQPFVTSFSRIVDQFGRDKYEAACMCVNLLTVTLTGVDPSVVTDAFVSIADAFNGDFGAAKEFCIAMYRLNQFPQKQIDEIYIDELGIWGKDIKGTDMGTLARRYADYMRHRNAPYLDWARDDDAEQKANDKYIKKIDTKVKERLEGRGIEWLEDAYVKADPHLQDLIGKAIKKRVVDVEDEALKDLYDNSTNEATRKAAHDELRKRMGAERDPISGDSEYNKVYNRIKTTDDMEADIELAKAQAAAKAAGDRGKEKAIAGARSKLSGIRKGLGRGNDEQVMETLRNVRQKMLDRFVNGEAAE